jgi:uncharacterized protein with HEPN domain
MQAHDRIRLGHMLAAAREAVAFAANRTRADLDRDRLLQLGLTRLVEIIGEAAAQVSDESRALQPTVPWVKIVAMRNRLVHAYFSVNLDILWDTVTLELSPLIAHLEAWLADDAAPKAQ